MKDIILFPTARIKQAVDDQATPPAPETTEAIPFTLAAVRTEALKNLPHHEVFLKVELPEEESYKLFLLIDRFKQCGRLNNWKREEGHWQDTRTQKVAKLKENAEGIALALAHALKIVDPNVDTDRLQKRITHMIEIAKEDQVLKVGIDLLYRQCKCELKA